MCWRNYMGKHIKWLLFALGFLLVLFSINQLQQRNLGSNSDQIFSIKRDDVFQFQIAKGDESVALTFNGESWSIDGNDTLLVKENTINGFFNNVLKVKRTSLVSKNTKNWDKYNVGDSTGTHLIVKDYNGEILAKVTVGRSSAEWAYSNIRVAEEIEVYQTNENISFQLNTSPTYWGEVPPPPQPDSTVVDSL